MGAKAEMDLYLERETKTGGDEDGKYWRYWIVDDEKRKKRMVIVVVRCCKECFIFRRKFYLK